MTLGFGVIGAGVVGALRAKVLAGSAHTRLVGIADLDQVAARKAAGSDRALVCTDYRELLEREDVEAVVVAAPTQLHFGMCRDALLAGKHVLCEKPMASSLTDCKRLLELARQQDRLFAIGFNHRFYPCFQHLRTALLDGTVGQIQHVRAVCGHQGLSEFRAEWNYQSEHSGGGVMMDLGIHLTDLIGYLFGRVESVYGKSSNRIWEVEGSENHASALMTTKRGIPVAYHATWGEWKGFRLMLEVYGSDAVARAYCPMLNLVAPRAVGRPPVRWSLHPWVNLREKLFGWETTAEIAFHQEIEEFINRLNGKPYLSADGAAGFDAIAVAQALYQSQNEDCVVTVERP